jgi:hypothetical protein
MNKQLTGIFIALILTLSLVPARAQTPPAFDPRYDLNNDGVLDIRDVSALTTFVEANYGATAQEPPATATPAPATPEPATPEPTATPVAAPTATATPHAHPTQAPGALGACGESMSAWHPPVVDGCATGHEHGDAPPAWVMSANTPKPFSQSRESHVGYKGVFARHSSGAESYWIAHILSTAPARAHGDHDYQLWLKTTDGRVYYWDGLLCFANPCAGTPPLRTSDTGERPIILAQRDAGCETWYGRAERGIVDVEWVICGRNQHFDLSQSSGVGTHRTMGWIFYQYRFSGEVAQSLARDCRFEFGFCRLQFLVSAKEYPKTGVIIPN